MKTRMIKMTSLALCLFGLSSCMVQQAEFQNMKTYGDGHMQTVEFDLLSNIDSVSVPDIRVEINDARITSYSYVNDGSRRMKISFFSLENIDGQEIVLSLYPAQEEEIPIFLKHLNQQQIKVNVHCPDPYSEYQTEKNGTIDTGDFLEKIHISPYAMMLTGTGALQSKETIDLFNSQGELYATNQVRFFSTSESEGKKEFAYIGEFEKKIDPAQISKIKVDGKTYFIHLVKSTEPRTKISYQAATT